MPVVGNAYQGDNQNVAGEGIGTILSILLNTAPGRKATGWLTGQGNQDQLIRSAAKKELGIDTDSYTIKELQDMRKEKYKTGLNPENKLMEILLSGLGNTQNQNSNPAEIQPVVPEGSIMPGTQPSNSGDTLGLDKGKMLRGLLSKKFGVPYEQMMTPEEKQQATQQKVTEAQALEKGKGLSSDAAGKLAMVTQAESDLNDAESLLFPGGKFAPSMAFQTNFPGGGMPATEGRQAYSKVLNAVNAKLRIETGAQANPSEVKNILERFLPTMRDTDETAKDKFRRLKEFMSTTKAMIDPRGRFDNQGAAGKTSSGVGYTIE